MNEEKSKSTLALMEQAIMILVFAVAATLCVQAFVRANLYSEELYRRDRAVNLCQTAAETVKAKRGELTSAAILLDGEVSDGKLYLFYNKEWKTVGAGEAAYVLCMEETGRSDSVVTARVCVTEKKSSEELFALPVSWQEVANE